MEAPIEETSSANATPGGDLGSSLVGQNRRLTGSDAQYVSEQSPAISADVWALAAEVGRLYPAVYRRFHVSRQAKPGADVTPRMLTVLQHLAASGPLTLGELTLHLALGKATVTELVDRLEARRLVDRMRDERDKRRVFIWLTDEGRARAFAHPQVLRDDLLARALARMQPDDCGRLVLGLHALLNAVEELEP